MKPLFICTVLCVITLTGMIIALTIQPTPGFTPPPFDNDAVYAVPEVPDGLEHSFIGGDGLHFTAWVCGEIVLDGDKADIYFTNPDTNDLWMKLRILDENNDILGETGLIRPGEYVKSITFATLPDIGATVQLKLMTYEPETYMSLGAVSLWSIVG